MVEIRWLRVANSGFLRHFIKNTVWKLDVRMDFLSETLTSCMVRIHLIVTHFKEAILLEIKMLQRSNKVAHKRIFKNKETGGMVVFGTWYNYAL